MATAGLLLQQAAASIGARIPSALIALPAKCKRKASLEAIGFARERSASSPQENNGSTLLMPGALSFAGRGLTNGVDAQKRRRSWLPISLANGRQFDAKEQEKARITSHFRPIVRAFVLANGSCFDGHATPWLSGMPSCRCGAPVIIHARRRWSTALQSVSCVPQNGASVPDVSDAAGAAVGKAAAESQAIPAELIVVFGLVKAAEA